MNAAEPGHVRRNKAARCSFETDGAEAVHGRRLMMSPASIRPFNRLLLALPPGDLSRVMPDLEQVPCRVGDVLIEADTRIHHIYFPDNCIISVVAVYSNGDIIEMATIGREGATGFQAVFDIKTSAVRFLVQVPGSATRLPRAAFMRAMASIAYVPALLQQVLVSVACNGRHSLKQRLARWLLAMRDRVDSDTLFITQDLLADMLGVYRPSITHVVRELELAGVVARGRREITILDRDGLIRESCECYQLVRQRIALYLPKTYPG
jgi:CRP-like cAMP-binding protein